MGILLAALLAQQPHALVIGVDGVTTSAMQTARVPNLRSIGALQTGVRIHNGDRRADTVTGPGWASVLCGSWGHGVRGNDIARPPCATSWAVFSAVPVVRDLAGLGPQTLADTRRPYADGADAAMVSAALRHLDERVVFVHLAAVDEAGHNDGWGSPAYRAALERADAQVGELLAAVRARTGESWLMIATTDHGGNGQSHNAGWDDPEVSLVWAATSRGQVRALVDVRPLVDRWVGYGAPQGPTR